MEPREYVVEQIDGDYAHLRRTDAQEEELSWWRAPCFRMGLWREAVSIMRCWNIRWHKPRQRRCPSICYRIDRGTKVIN